MGGGTRPRLSGQGCAAAGAAGVALSAVAAVVAAAKSPTRGSNLSADPCDTVGGDSGYPGRHKRRAEVVQRCLDAVADADIVFAWINCATGYGTLFELGHAFALRKEIWIGSPSAESLDDLWFAFKAAGANPLTG